MIHFLRTMGSIFIPATYIIVEINCSFCCNADYKHSSCFEPRTAPNDINYNLRTGRSRPEMCIQLYVLQHMVNLCIAFVQFAPDVHVYLVFGILLSLSPDTGSHAKVTGKENQLQYTDALFQYACNRKCILRLLWSVYFLKLT